MLLKIVGVIYPRVSGSRSPNDSNSNQQEWINISTSLTHLHILEMVYCMESDMKHGS